MHGFLGVLVPDEVVARGPRATATFVSHQMEPHNMLHLVEPYVHRLSSEDVAGLARLHGAPRGDLERLASVIVDDDGFIASGHREMDEIGSVVSTGVDDEGLYCVTREHDDWHWDVRYWGGRWKGLLAGTWAGPESDPFRRYRPSRIRGCLQPNIAPVGDVLAWMVRTREHPFDSLLMPDGSWEHGRCCWSRRPHRGPDCPLWAFRESHHIVGVDYEH